MSEYAIQLARHALRIAALEERDREISAKLDWLVRLLITTLIAAVGGLVLQLAKR